MPINAAVDHAAKVSIERLAQAAGVIPVRAGDRSTGKCPFHADNAPELVIDCASNTWVCPICMPGGGGPVEWVMHHRGVSRTQAGIILQAELGEDSTAKIEWPDNPDAVVDRVADYYHHALLQDDEAIAYLERRGLRDEALIGTLGLGYSNRTLGYRLPSRDSLRGRDVRERLQATGIMRGSGHEHLSGSLVVPVRDHQGEVLDLYGRKIRSDLRKGTPLHLFLHEQPPSAWLLDPANADSQNLIVTSSVMDALSWWVAGLHGVLVVPTMSATVEEVRAALGDRKVDRAVIAFGRNKAGEAAAATLASLLAELGTDVHRTVFPAGADANDLLLKDADLKTFARNAEWMTHGVGRDRTPAPAPESPASEDAVAAAASPDEIAMTLGDRRWRVRGLERNTSPEVMRVNVMVTREEVGMHVDSFDLYSHRHRAGFTKQAAVEIGVEERVIKADIGKLLLHLEDLQDQRLKQEQRHGREPVRLTRAERDEALQLLRASDLIDRIVADMTGIGLVGEDTNKLVAYLAAVSRKLDTPLAILIQSASSAGKSTVMDAVLDLVPDEEKVTYSAMTGQSLFYVGQGDLKHKVLSIAEEEGASRASYALKLLQSEGSLTIASTDKDAGTGRLVTREYHVEGPVALMLTTTAAEVDEELANRCIVLTVDEGRDQTRQIHQRQRQAQTLDGMLARRERDRIVKLHQNAQRLLRPIMVVNPHALNLSFADHQTRTRRDHAKYLTLIRAVALLHQHQRHVKTAELHGEAVEYIEVTDTDIEIANRLAHEALGRSLDEVAPQTRKLLGLLHELVGQDCARLGVERTDYRFTRRQLRERLAWGNTQLRVHLARLVDLEYVVRHRFGAGIGYELCWTGSGQDGRPFLNGIEGTTTGSERGQEADQAGGWRPGNGPETVGERVAESTESPGKEASICTGLADTPKMHVGMQKKIRSYKGKGRKG